MIEIPGPIPVSIHPFFWLFAFLIGWLNSASLIGAFMWVGIILVSVLIHEYGHALTAICFKQKTRIQLVALGGLTSFDGPKLKFWQQFLITFNGPLFGFGLFLLATYALTFHWGPAVTIVLKYTQIANLFWTIINLLPVLPLDGGQLLRIILEAFFGVKGFKAALLVGAILSALISLYFFMLQGFLIGAIFFLFAFQSFDMWRKSRFATSSDRDDGTTELMTKAEIALQEGRKEDAKKLLYEIIEKAPKSLMALASAQYLAYLLMQEKKHEEAYQILLPIKSQLSDDALPILHTLAAEHKNDSLVCELSADVYQTAPTQKGALANARSFARLGKAKEAGGWLQTALQYGGLTLSTLLQEEAFAKVKNDPQFTQFL